MKWAGGFPVFAERAEGSTVFDVDGNEYADFCLGDTGAMTGHAPPAVVATAAEQSARAITTMMPSPDAPAVGEALVERFGLPLWQVTLSATDANRFAIRMARQITGRPRILIFNWCYHGTVDETFAVLREGRVVARPGNVGPPVELDAHHPRGRVQRRRGARRSPWPRRRGVRACRAGHDQHRDSAP